MKLHHEPHEGPEVRFRPKHGDTHRAYIDIGDVTLEVGLNDTRDLFRVTDEAFRHLKTAELARKESNAEWARGQSGGVSLMPEWQNRAELG